MFAYGATGSGKTHTMVGNAESGSGVMVLAIETLFDLMSEETDNQFQLEMSYLEIYNEVIRDLMTDTDKASLNRCTAPCCPLRPCRLPCTVGHVLPLIGQPA